MKHILPRFVLLLGLISLVMVQAIAQTEVIAGWTFESEEVSQRINADLGNANNTGENTQVITPVNINFTDYVLGSGGSGTFAKNANQWQEDGDTEKYWQVRVNTLGFENLQISSIQRGSNTGPRDFRIDYSLNGTDWITIPGSNITVANNFTSGVVNALAIPAEVSNQEQVFFRWIPTSTINVNGGTIAPTGTNRIDDILIEGIALEDDVPAVSSTLVSWDFEGEPGNQAATSGQGSENISALDFIRGSAITPTAAGNSISGSNWSTGENAYFEFGLTIEEGFEAKLDELLIATRSSNTGPADLALRYSVDNFESDLANWVNSGINFTNLRLDLSSLEALTSTVRFRIVVTSTVSANGGTLGSGGTLRAGNLFESGTFFPVQFTGILTESEVIPPADPEPIVNYDFNGEPGNQDFTSANLTADGLLALDFARGEGINASNATNSISSSGWNAGDDRYFTFGFTVAPDKLVDLTLLEIGTRASGTGPKDMALRYSGDNFTSNLATWVNPANEFFNQVIDLSNLQNLSGTVEFRIVTTSETSAADGNIGSGGTLRVTNFFPTNVGTTLVGIVKDAEGVIIPGLTVNPSSLDFGAVSISGETQVLSYELAAVNLETSINVTSTAPFSISKDGVNFSASLEYSVEEMTSAQTVFVMFDNTAEGDFNSAITNQTEGTLPVTVNVTGSVFDPFNIFEDFNNICQTNLSPIGGSWSTISVFGDQVWSCTNFGRAGTTPTASAPFGMQINGFAAGSARLNEDWLITPEFDLTGFNIPLLSFYSRVAFNGPRLKLLISTNYIDGDPNTATWTELDDRFANGDVWTFSGELDLTEYLDQKIRLAFVYNSSPEEGAARWTLDDFELRSSAVPAAPFFSNNIGNVDYFHFGIIPAGTVSTETRSFDFNLSNPIAPLTINNGPVGGFEFSKDGVEFSSNLTYQVEELSGNKTVTVRFAPSSEGAFSGPITFESGDISVKRGYLSGATVSKDKTFDVVTWNIEWFGSASNGPNNLDLQLQNVKTIIEDLDADVYAFQEITGLEKFNELVDALEDYEGFVSPATSLGPDNFETAQKLTFLYKKSTVEPIKTRVLLEGVQAEDLVDYPSSPDRFWASGRLPFLMEVKANIDDKVQKFNLINVHARSNGGGESAGNPRYAMRKYDVNVLKDSLDMYYGNVPLIILGDYNDDLDETVANQEAPTVNTAETSYISYINDVENYTAVTLSLSNAGLRTFPTFENVIDHMIISNELSENWLVNSERVVAPFELVQNYLSTTSDHIPVKSRFTLSCDIDIPVIIGDGEVCSGSGSTELQLFGGNFLRVVNWEESLDGGETWEAIEASEGTSSLEVSDLTSSRFFRAKVESNLCFNVTEAFEVTVKELPEPVILFEQGKLVTIEGDYNFTWYKDGQMIQTGPDNSVRIAGAGEYQVVIQDELGCERSSDIIRFPIRPTKANVRVFPNPANNMVNISLRNAEGLSNVELRSAAGSLIASELTREGFVQFDVAKLSKGVYLIVITDQHGQKQIERLIIR
ncbi:MAG: T9SS C-terminal target domain-containing protein [Mongoliibacter sp.]|uniref:T9SS-dependent choice-of-anchor J family protein n=1 Tax=Mongoliibacter sp. TaxID=2022438 RepID=UPI0012F2AA96|nr:choice-of-anchor J domain-containing protein [Mongoliibacter sp.]TVP43518.1 MAG: T9SS C-terminal target domain-containing protein [Mongoliibacter sp.]